MLHRRFRLWVPAIFVLLMISVWSGCGPREQISEYRIRKDKNPEWESEPVAENVRMVLGLIQREEDWWVFKVMGSESEVTRVTDQYMKFFETVGDVDADVPSWKAPDGWQMKAVSRMAASAGGYANFQFADSELLMKISRLPKQDLLDNTQRWRGQLGLQPIPATELDSQWEKTDFAGGALKIFDQMGRGGGGMMGAPFAGGRGGMPSKRPQSPPSKPSKQGPQVKFAIPEGWIKLPNSPVVEAKLTLEGNEDKVAISLTRMSGDFNDFGKQAKSWASDAKVDWDEEKIKQATRELEIAGSQAKRIDLIPDTNGEDDQAIVGIMFEKGGYSWFVKMNGEPETVKNSEPALSQFLKTLTIE